MKVLSLATQRRTQWINITREVQAAVEALGLRDGSITVFVPHTTAGVTINEQADPDVAADLGAALARLVPEQDAYRHGEGNSDAHIKASLMGAAVPVLVRDGRLQLGTWQGIFFCEFDGPRAREIWVG